MLIDSIIPNKTNYVIVFDVDETLGHFTQLYTFWSLLIDPILNHMQKVKELPLKNAPFLLAVPLTVKNLEVNTA